MFDRYRCSPDRRLEWLDAVRGIAAVIVCATHIRAFMFVHFHDGANQGLFAKAFYGVTSLGHQAVIVFFALSGYLVGGSAFKQIFAQSWDLRRYLAKRLTRLYVVLLPALIITLICDLLGRLFAGSAFYGGELHGMILTGPTLAAPADDSARVFIGNILFINGILVPVFGSNSPLWSLSYELWYYLVFPPVLFSIIRNGQNIVRLFVLFAFFCFVIFFPTNLVILGSIWLAGACAFFVKNWTYGRYSIGKHALLILLAISAFWSLTFVTDFTARDALLGCGFAALIPCLTVLPNIGMSFVVGLSEISFTLYATHFPILALLWLTVFDHRQMSFSTHSLVIFTGALLFMVGYASVLWFLFESRTDRVRRFITGRYNMLLSAILPRAWR